MKREQAISVLKELLDNCVGLDGNCLELQPPIAVSSTGLGYQIVIKGTLDEQTRQKMMALLSVHGLAYQIGSIWKTKHSLNKSEPDTFIIYQSQTGKSQTGE